MFKIAVLISGNGSNLEALIDACKKDFINGSINIVISKSRFIKIKSQYSLIHYFGSLTPKAGRKLPKYKSAQKE